MLGFAAYQADHDAFFTQGLSKTLIDTVKIAVEVRNIERPSEAIALNDCHKIIGHDCFTRFTLARMLYALGKSHRRVRDKKTG